VTKERRLGRGLEALLGRPAGMLLDDFEPTHESAAHDDKGLTRLSVYEVDPNPYQPRRDFDDSEIIALCESLKEHGLPRTAFSSSPASAACGRPSRLVGPTCRP
jgi:ParB family chromosome partitioning protein